MGAAFGGSARQVAPWWGVLTIFALKASSTFMSPRTMAQILPLFLVFSWGISTFAFGRDSLWWIFLCEVLVVLVVSIIYALRDGSSGPPASNGGQSNDCSGARGDGAGDGGGGSDGGAGGCDSGGGDCGDGG